MESNKGENDNGMEIENEIVIEIGVREYVIDFAQMIQFDKENVKKQRTIRRVVEDQRDLKRSESLKGCAGKFFEKQNK